MQENPRTSILKQCFRLICRPKRFDSVICFIEKGQKNLDLGEPLVGFFTYFISVLNKNRGWAVMGVMSEEVRSAKKVISAILERPVPPWWSRGGKKCNYLLDCRRRLLVAG